MPSAISVRTAFSADELRQLAAATKHANQSRRLLSLAAVLDGMSRADAARIGGMDRQTLRECFTIGGGGPGRSFVRVGDLGPKDKLGLLPRIFGAAHDSVDPASASA